MLNAGLNVGKRVLKRGKQEDQSQGETEGGKVRME